MREQNEQAKEHAQGEGQKEKETLRWAGSLTWDSIPGPWDHDLSQRQMPNLGGAQFGLLLIKLLWTSVYQFFCGLKLCSVALVLIWAPFLTLTLGKVSLCRTFFFFFLKILFIYSWEAHRERAREAETQAEGEAGSMQGAQRGTRSQVSKDHVLGWRQRQTAEPPGLPISV